MGKLSEMGRRNLRIVKATPPAVGVCEGCNAMFKSYLRQGVQSQWEIKVQFERHRCKLRHAEQTDTGITTEATPSK